MSSKIQRLQGRLIAAALHQKEVLDSCARSGSRAAAKRAYSDGGTGEEGGKITLAGLMKRPRCVTRKSRWGPVESPVDPT